DADLATTEDLGERFLEQIGAIERPIGALNLGELVAFDGGEIPGILEQRPARSLQRRGLVGAGEHADLIASDLIDRVLRESLHVESVEDDLRLRRASLD